MSHVFLVVEGFHSWEELASRRQKHLCCSSMATYPKGHLPRIYGQLTLSFKCEHRDGTSEERSLEGRESPASLTLQHLYAVTTAVCSRGLMGSHVGSPRD